MDVWNLNDIYKGYDDPELLCDLAALEKSIGEIDCYMSENCLPHKSPSQVIAALLDLFEQYDSLHQKLTTYIKLTMSVDTEDVTAAGAFGHVKGIHSEHKPLWTRFQQYLVGIQDIETIVKTEPLLAEYRFLLTELLNNAGFMLSPEAEQAVARLSITGSAAWQNLQNRVTSDLFVEVSEQGKTTRVHINALKTLPAPPDNETKRRRFLCEMSAYKTHEVVSAACLNNIKGEALAVARLRGYSSPMHQSMVDCRMEFSIVDAMFRSIEQNLPKLRRYMARKAELLGYPQGLPYYEIPAQLGSSTRQFSIEQCKEMVQRSFYCFSDELGDFSARAIAGDWIDFTPRKGKVGGGFCASVHRVGQSRILVNYNGTLGDIVTVAHELGHGYHSSLLRGERSLNAHYPIPVAEIASTFCEMVLMDDLLTQGDTDTRFSLMSSDLTRASQLTMDILSRYYFETAVFERRAQRELSVEEICDCMVQGQQKSFGEVIDPDLFHKYMWLNKEHFFYVDRSYYNFSYAFGFLLSVGFHNLYLQDRARFIENYRRFLGASGKLGVVELCGIMGVDPTQQDFWLQSVDCVTRQMDEFEELCKEMKKL